MYKIKRVLKTELRLWLKLGLCVIGVFFMTSFRASINREDSPGIMKKKPQDTSALLTANEWRNYKSRIVFTENSNYYYYHYFRDTIQFVVRGFWYLSAHNITMRGEFDPNKIGAKNGRYIRIKKVEKKGEILEKASFSTCEILKINKDTLVLKFHIEPGTVIARTKDDIRLYVAQHKNK